MIKIAFTFFVIFLLFFFGIAQFRKMTGKEKWILTKLVGYSILCASLTVVTISFLVILF